MNYLLDFKVIEDNVAEYSHAKKIKFKENLVINGEKKDTFVLAQGLGLGARTVGVFDDETDELITEAQHDKNAVVELVRLSDNFKLDVK